MSDGEGQPSLIPQRAGEQLKAAREAQGLDIGEIAARTRIPQRHLESIETGNYSALPSTTYATGFARAYARAVGVDDVALVARVRNEISVSWDRPSQIAYEPDDPARVPSRGLMWVGVLVAVIVVVFAVVWFGSDRFRTTGGPPASVAVPGGDVAAPAAIPVPAPSPTQPAGGQVSLTATDEVWVRVYDAADATLVSRTLAKGERYDVPAGTNGAKMNVGRPDKLAVTVGGTAIAPLGDGRVPLSNVSLDPQALLARGTAPAVSASPAPVATPAPRPSPTAARSERRDGPRRPAPRASSPAPKAGAPESLLPPGLGGNTTGAR